MTHLQLNMGETVFSVIDKPLSAEDSRYADFYCVYNNGKIVDKFYDISEIENNKRQKTTKIFVELLFSLTYESGHDFDIGISEKIKDDLLNIWEVVEIIQESIALPSYVGFTETIVMKAAKYKIFSLSTRYDNLQKMAVLLFSTDLHDPHNKLYESSSDEMISYMYSDEIYPLYIKCLDIYKNILPKLVLPKLDVINRRIKTNDFYRLLDLFLDNLIRNFPEEEQKFTKFKTKSIIEKLSG